MAKVFQIADLNIYDELPNITPAVAVSAGDAALIENVLAFYIQSIDPTGTLAPGEKTEGTAVYRCRQVIALKKVGTSEACLPGQKLYYDPATKKVSVNKTGTAGTNCYLCGWVKLAAGASDTTVEMNYDGTRAQENV